MTDRVYDTADGRLARFGLLGPGREMVEAVVEAVVDAEAENGPTMADYARFGTDPVREVGELWRNHGTYAEPDWRPQSRLTIRKRSPAERRAEYFRLRAKGVRSLVAWGSSEWDHGILDHVVEVNDSRTAIVPPDSVADHVRRSENSQPS